MTANGGNDSSEKLSPGHGKHQNGVTSAPGSEQIGDFRINASELSELSNERTRLALANALEIAVKKEKIQNGSVDVEAQSNKSGVDSEIRSIVTRIRDLEEAGPPIKHSPEETEANKNAEIAATMLTNVLLASSVEKGISQEEVEHRREIFGSNGIADKNLDSFLKLCWEAVQDFVLIMLIVLGITTIVVETTLGKKGKDETEHKTPPWLEGAAILCSVCIVVFVTAGIDYAKQFAFIRLTKSLNETNTKSVIRDGKQINVTDEEIVVGDILSINSHSLASIPADCVLLGPCSDLKTDESTLTGESKEVSKKPGDVVLSGTTVTQGQGKMVVIAVGLNSVAGKIKARVYESEEHEDDLDGEDENSPLFVKLDLLAKRIGLIGTAAAILAFAASCIIGLAINSEAIEKIVDYFIVAITVLAVAVPEGLPLAVTLALAFSSGKMMKEQNLVKVLHSCETMGCATTICTDKTGTLTANKMTARALLIGLKDYIVDDPKIKLADYIKTSDGGANSKLLDILAKLIAIDTMNETVLEIENGEVCGSSGNPTEVALLTLTQELGFDYADIRNTTKGRSDQGHLATYLAEGKQFGFSSARKMMSYAIPLENGGYRIYTKGAQEVILSRCTKIMDESGDDISFSDNLRENLRKTGLTYTRRGMRCLGLAYRDVPADFDLEKLSETAKNSDGTEAFEAETDLVALGLVGIEDPLRAEVPDAIQKCYEAGIDVRLVTGDNAETAVSIAYQAGILRDEHFEGSEKVAINLKPNVLMEGKSFRNAVHREEEEGGKKEFDQAAFDKIWPHLRVLARSSPDDKLTLAHGLNQSTLYADKSTVKKLKNENGILIFPDRQVVAMTGDGTNDAPALKRADIGFAMGIAGTQIAKDAADIILLDDNFASIVTAAKWGRNIYASIQKFLQFQLTVNISAVFTALVGAFSYQVAPIAAIQMLWVNLLMDSLASLALASEPPVDTLLQKPPVNRTEGMITKRMWANMLGQATYQIVVNMVLFFSGPSLLDLRAGHLEEADGVNSIHYTIIFNTFVWMQLFNEINCRSLKGELNVFSGIQNNSLFCSVLIITGAIQVLIVQVPGLNQAFHISEGGLEAKWWGLGIAIGAGSLLWQQIINVFYRFGLNYKGYRKRRMLKRNASLIKRNANEELTPLTG